MKKIILYVLCLFILVGCSNKKEDVVLKEKFLIGHTLEDGRVIHFSFDVPYNNSYISEALINKEITIDEFLNNLDYLSTLNDGGSTLYEYNLDSKVYGEEKFYVITCNSLNNIRDIYVAKYKENLIYNCSKKIDDLDGVSMIIKEGTLTSVGAIVIIKDNSDRDNIYGDSYTIEKMEDSRWVKLESKHDMVFNSIGYTVGEDNIIEFDINWEYYYGKLESGKYRIIKDTSESGEGVRHYITVEFVIE